MAKTAIKQGGAQTGSKSMIKVVKAVKADKGHYTFKEAIVHKDDAKEWMANN